MSPDRAREEILPQVSKWRRSAGVFLLSLGLMLFELCSTRVFSVLFYYHTAFLAISLALLGMGIGGLWVHLLPGILRGRQRLLLAGASLGTALLPFAFQQLHLSLDELDQVAGGAFLLALTTAVLLCLVPFVCGGALLALLFEAGRETIGRLYGADLLGAAVATLLLIPTMEWLGGPGALFFCGAIIASAGFLLFAERRRSVMLSSLLMLGLGLVQLFLAPWSIDVDTGIDAAGEENSEVLFKKWNAFSRVVVLNHMGWERGLSEEREEVDRGLRPEQIEALIDINAYAPLLRFDGDLLKVSYLGDLVSNLGHQILPSGRRVAIIGPGCGKDVLGALLHQPERVLGIEINPILVEDVVRGRFASFAGGLYDHPRVEIVVGDGRAELTRREERFDLIIANSVATWAAHSSGAMNLSEQNLFTQEAVELYLRRLTPGGILSISLWDEAKHSLPLRLAATFAAAKGSGEGALSRRVAVVGNAWDEGRWFTTVLMSPRPFTPNQQAMLSQLTEELGFDGLHLPGDSQGSCADFDAFFADPEGYRRGSRYDLEPATDDHPFFFYSLRPEQAFRIWEPETHSDNIAWFSLVLSFVIVAMLVVLALGLPWAIDRRRRRLEPSLSDRHILGFCGLGAAYMLVEISVIQRLTTVLGHPTLALCVALGGILAFSGLGSRWADRWHSRGHLRSPRGPVALLVIILPLWWWLAQLATPVLHRLGEGERIAAVLMALAPLGLAMGVPMPLSLRMVGGRAGAPIPWAWAVNGACGVLASVAAILIAVIFGFRASFGVGVLCYAFVLLVWPKGSATRSK